MSGWLHLSPARLRRAVNARGHFPAEQAALSGQAVANCSTLCPAVWRRANTTSTVMAAPVAPPPGRVQPEPVRVAARPLEPAVVSEAVPQRAETILLVEDDAPTRTFLADNLTADGYELLAVATGAQTRDAEHGKMSTRWEPV